MKSYRVILDCERMKYPYTGLYFFCRELGECLVKENVEGIDLAYYVPPAAKSIFGENQSYIIQHSLDKFLSFRSLNCNLWHCTYQSSNYLPSNNKQIKLLSTIHDLNYLHQGKSLAKQKKSLKKIQQLINRSDVIVAISHFVKNDILQHLDVGNKKIEVIYNGGNRSGNTNPSAPLVLPKVPFFFSIGTIARKKNFHVLPALLLKNDFELIIAGINQDEGYWKEIIATANKLGVRDRVKLVGPIPDKEKYWYLQNCVAFCFPSIAEGFGLPVVEAMQMGVPVIISKATSLPEIGGPYATYFDNFDPETVSKTAEDFLNAPTTVQKKTELQKWAGQFQWSFTAREYLALYKSLL